MLRSLTGRALHAAPVGVHRRPQLQTAHRPPPRRPSRSSRPPISRKPRPRLEAAQPGDAYSRASGGRSISDPGTECARRAGEHHQPERAAGRSAVPPGEEPPSASRASALYPTVGAQRHPSSNPRTGAASAANGTSCLDARIVCPSMSRGNPISGATFAAASPPPPTTAQAFAADTGERQAPLSRPSWRRITSSCTASIPKRTCSSDRGFLSGVPDA